MKVVRQRLDHVQVDTGKPIVFYFDGKAYRGYEGDTLASALLANGINIVGRSFKLHRPRGIFAAGKEEVNAFVQLEEGPWTEPNVRATIQPIYPGLRAFSQNAWPSVHWDLWAVLGLFKHFLPASFYYKTFMWPNWTWWEGMVRHMAGLGKAPKARDKQQYHKRNLHTDVLIVGGGPAGITAALTASQSATTRVVLLDEQEAWGGSLLARRESINGQAARQWIKNSLADLEQRPNVKLMGCTTAVGYYDHNVLVAVERLTVHLGPSTDPCIPRERLWRVRTKQVILATGAIERPLVFPHNDRPGIMLASAVEQYTHRYGLKLANKLIFYTNNNSVYKNAVDLANAGVGVSAVVDVRHQVNQGLVSALKEKGIGHYPGFAVTATKGRCRVKKITLTKLDQAGGSLVDKRLRLNCDLLAMSGGWTPTVHLFSQSGGKLDFDHNLSCFLPSQAVQACVVTGSANGKFSTKACLEAGRAAAIEVIGKLGKDVSALSVEAYHADNAAFGLQPFWLTPGVPADYQWIDFQYDVTAADIELAARENFVSVEHLKRYTTTGMSIDQGKTSNVNALAILAHKTEQQIPCVGTTRFRPPYHPVTIGTFAGRELGPLYRPRQDMPGHSWHVANGGHFQDYGGWQRPEYYSLSGEDEHTAIFREVKTVRSGVGIFEASPLGKIEVRGPDAEKFLHRIYINNIQTLKVGAARYGLMLNEKGIVVDDGVLVRLAKDHFLMHTTSGGAATISAALEEWLQCGWVNLQVLVTNMTTQWATTTVTGPKARQVLQKLASDIDFDCDAFPHMQFREGRLMGVPARILRASFTGEVSYEISVPANCGLSLLETLMDVGEEFGIIPFGVESLMVMRAEKGYLHVGQDTDGTTMPQDLGWGGAIAKKDADFVGKRSLTTEQGLAGGRFQFVGIEPIYPQAEILNGAHVLSPDSKTTQGYVTSACVSPTLGRTVALGLVSDGSKRIGETVSVYYNGAIQQATLVKPGAYDPKGDALVG